MVKLIYGRGDFTKHLDKRLVNKLIFTACALAVIAITLSVMYDALQQLDESNSQMQSDSGPQSISSEVLESDTVEHSV